MDVLETLFSVLPVVIAVIWIMSRVGSVRKNRRASSGSPPENGSDDAAERRETEKKTVPASGSFADWVAVKARQARSALEFEDAKKASRGEDELYTRLEKRRVGPVGNRDAVPPAPAASTTRIVEDRISPYEKDEADGASSALDRIEKLPPLARGVVWSVILDEPPSLKGPPER